MTHDYKRNGTTTLFAALNASNDEVYHLCQQRHRYRKWLKFLRMIDQTVPADKQRHIICDNYGTHKHERVSGGSNDTSASMCTSRRPLPRG
jgi:hypothetical protein